MYYRKSNSLYRLVIYLLLLLLLACQYFHPLHVRKHTHTTKVAPVKLFIVRSHKNVHQFVVRRMKSPHKPMGSKSSRFHGIRYVYSVASSCLLVDPHPQQNIVDLLNERSRRMSERKTAYFRRLQMPWHPFSARFFRRTLSLKFNYFYMNCIWLGGRTLHYARLESI